MKAKDISEHIGQPAKVQYRDPVFGSERTAMVGIIIGETDEAERHLVVLQLANGRGVHVDPTYVNVLPPNKPS